MEARTARLQGFSVSRMERGGERTDHLADEKRKSQRAVTEELLRRVTEVDPDTLERLRVRAERKPDKLTAEQEAELHEGVMQLAGVRLKGAEEIELKDPGSYERLIVTSGSHRGGIQRIAHISPDHEEMGTSEGIVSIRPVYIPHFRVDENQPMLRQENSVSSLDEYGEPLGTRIHPRHPSPGEVARLIPLLRDGELTGQISPEARPDAASQAEA